MSRRDKIKPPINEIDCENALYIKNIVFDTTITGNSIADKDGNLIEVNPAFLTIWGFNSKSEVLGKHVSFFLQDSNKAYEIIDCLNTTGSWCGDYVAKKKDGSTFMANGQATSLLGSSNNIIGYQSTVIDMTDRKHLEEALIEREYFFSESQRAANIGSYKYNFITDKWESSEVLNAIFGIDENYKKTSQGWLDIVYHEDRDMMRDYLANDIGVKHLPFNKEYRIVQKSTGEIKWVHGLGSLVKGENGELQVLMGTIKETTKEKNIKDTLTANLQKFKALIETNKIAFLSMTMDGVIREANDVFAELIGCKDEKYFESSNTNITSLLTQEDSYKIKRSIALLEKGISIEDLEVCIDNKLFDKKGVWIRINGNIIDNGEKIILCLVKDITSKKMDEFKKYISDQKQKDRVRQNISRIRNKIQNMRNNQQEGTKND